MLLQKIKKQYPSALEVGVKYYFILSVLNNLELTKREVELMAFTAVRGDISGGGAKQQFIDWTKSSKATIGNLISSLYEKKLLVKDDGGKIKVIPALQVDFNKEIVLQLNISTKDVERKGPDSNKDS